MTYLVASTTNNDSNDSSTNANVESLAASANHATRVSPATVSPARNLFPCQFAMRSFLFTVVVVAILKCASAH